jgi:hypothetical protein
VSGEQDQGSYIREKLRSAATTIRDDDGRSIEERLWSAYRDNLSSLRPEWFPHADAQAEFAAIEEELSRYGEAVEGAGSVPTTLWTMPDEEAALLGARILVLADRYLA